MRGRALVTVENQETESNTGAGASSDHLGCPGGAIQTMACGRGGGTYKSAAVGCAAPRDPAVFPRITGSVLRLGHGVSERC
jgi:hypothetical protein